MIHESTRRQSLLDVATPIDNSQILKNDDNEDGNDDNEEDDDDVSITPPLEVLVRRHTLGNLEGSSSVFTEITFEASFDCSIGQIDNMNDLMNQHCESSNRACGCTASVISDVSSLADDKLPHTPAPDSYYSSGDENQHQQPQDPHRLRIPQRQKSAQSLRRRHRRGLCNGAKRSGIMRWASMPSTKSLSCHSRSNSSGMRGNQSPYSCSNSADKCLSPPRRQCSFASDSGDDEKKENISTKNNNHRRIAAASAAAGGGGTCTSDPNSRRARGRGMPRLPTRKASSGSLFSNVSTRSASTIDTKENVVSALAA